MIFCTDPGAEQLSELDEAIEMDVRVQVGADQLEEASGRAGQGGERSREGSRGHDLGNLDPKFQWKAEEDRLLLR